MNGYVYILINSSMPGMIKIGRTIRDSRARARELRSTGVPTSFTVAFDLFSENCTALESQIHGQLADFRVASNREFFRYPLHEAIKLLQQLHCPPKSPASAYAAQDILEALKQKYPDWLKPNIVGVSIVQSECRTWLEITAERQIAEYLVGQHIHRSDLAFIADDHENGEHAPLFPSNIPVSENARNFVEGFDAYSIAMTTDLFHDEACHVICHTINPHK